MRVRLLDPELYAEESGAGWLGSRYHGDAGLDLRSSVNKRIYAGETGVIGLGVAVEVPYGCVGWLTGRSTTALEMGLFVHEGKIDHGYRGEIHCFATAAGSPVEVKRGDRLAQLVVVHIAVPNWDIVDELPEADRGDRGLGSTGLR